MTEPVVTLSSVSVGFGDLSVVDDLSLSVEPGAFVALVGPNGAGKTTLGELLAGLRAPDAGTVDHRGEARAAAYLPQSPAFRPGFTAAETLGFYAALAGAPSDADRYLSRVGLGGAADRPVEALSGGMTRLLGLAQALVGDPPLVEPVGRGGQAAQGVQVGGDGNAVRALMHEERLAAERVAGSNKPAGGRLPEHEGKGPLERIHEGRSPLSKRREHQVHVRGSLFAPQLVGQAPGFI